MIRNYIAVAIRNIKANPLSHGIKSLSLAIGIAVNLIIYLFVSEEFSFDAIHHNRGNIVRVYTEPHYAGSNVEKVAITMGWIGPVLNSDFPEVVNATRFWNKGDLVMNNADKQFLIENVSAVDSTFLEIFDFPLLAGEEKTALQNPYSITISEETAAKFFENPIEALGKSLTINNEAFKITGILKSIPENSHLQFSALISISTYSKSDPMFLPTWDGSFLNTYVQLHDASELTALESKLPDFLVRHTGKKDLAKDVTLKLQPLSEVHLSSSDIEHDYNNYHKFNGLYIKLFIAIGLFVLAIASLNFVNLTLAGASGRWKEVGVRKSIGARRFNLFGQFIFESTIATILSLILSLGFVSLFLPFLNNTIDRNIDFMNLFGDGLVVVTIFSIPIVIGVLAGIYPATYIASYKIIPALKGTAQNKGGGNRVSQGMVIVQFSIAIGMIIGTIAVTQQLSFMKNSDIGFNKDQIVLLPMNPEVNQKFGTLKTEWLRNTHIAGVTASSQRIGNNFNGWGFKVQLDSGLYSFAPANINVDYDYLKVYQIELEEGRNFSRDIASDKGRGFIINETMLKDLNLKNPIGTQAGHAWYEDNNLGTIIGVAKDFNYNSLHNKIGMLAMVCHPEWGYEEISIRIDGANMQESLSEIKNVWDKNINTHPFNYTFLDEHFKALYRSDQQMGWSITMLAGTAILIACMGLFGLVAIVAHKRLKEIGIRKTLGASSFQITTMLANSFARLMTIAFVLVCPIAYYLLNAWLQNFSYRIHLEVWVFVAGGLIALAVAFLTISYHTIKAAFGNPVEWLRSE